MAFGSVRNTEHSPPLQVVGEINLSNMDFRKLVELIYNVHLLSARSWMELHRLSF